MDIETSDLGRTIATVGVASVEIEASRCLVDLTESEAHLPEVTLDREGAQEVIDLLEQWLDSIR